MKKDYVITVTDSHKTDDDDYSSELTVLGEFETNGSESSVTYTETDPTMDGALTTVRFCGTHRVEITREGAFGTQLILEKGKRHICLYSTPFGQISVGVFTHFIETSFCENGGDASFGYTLNFDSGEKTNNTLSLKIREAN